MTRDEQLERWLAGDPQHRHDDDIEGGECCPDFSCCRHQLLVPIETREAFVKAYKAEDYKTWEGMLMSFLGAALFEEIGEEEGNVYIAGDPTNLETPP